MDMKERELKKRFRWYNIFYRRGKGITHFTYALIVVMVTAVMFHMFIGLSPMTLNNLTTRLYSKTLTFVLGLLFTLFWRTKSYDTDFKIYQDPKATAIYLGCWILAIGWS